MERNQTNMPSSTTTSSLWMITLAVAQSAAWLFLLPLLCKPIWRDFLGNDTWYAESREILLNTFGNIAVFAMYSVFVFPLYYMEMPFFEQYKIHHDTPWPWKSDKENVRRKFWVTTHKSLKLMAFNQLFLVPLLTYVKILTFTTPSSFFETTPDSWPSTKDMIQQNILMTFLHELLFHSSHRMMHSHKWLYQKFHKVHHEYTHNTLLAAQHNHPVDFIVSVVGPAALTTAIVAPHSVVQFQWIVWTVVANLDDHVGYAFPWSPVRWFVPLASLTEHHEYHHSVNRGCYSSKINVYEQLFQTEGTFGEWNKKRQQRSSSPSQLNDPKTK